MYVQNGHAPLPTPMCNIASLIPRLPDLFQIGEPGDKATIHIAPHPLIKIEKCMYMYT